MKLQSTNGLRLTSFRSYLRKGDGTTQAVRFFRFSGAKPPGAKGPR